MNSTRKRKRNARRPGRAMAIALCAGFVLSALPADASAQQRGDERRRNRVMQPGGQDGRAGRDMQDTIAERLRQLREEQRQLTMRRGSGDREAINEQLARVRNEISRLEQRSSAFGGPGNEGEENARGPAGNVDGAIRGELLEEEGVVELAFPGGGVSLEEFINWIQRVLDINIISREEVRGQEVLLGEPLQFETGQLLDLLSALLARDGLALFRHDVGFYEIMPANNLPPVFREGELITTRVIPTTLISPSAIQTKIDEALGQSKNQVRLSALDDVGVLLVTGTPGMTETVARLVQKYVDVRGEMQLFTHAFENVSADWGRQRILSLYDRISQTGRERAGQEGRPGDGLSNLSEKLILDQGNTLIFRGRPEEWLLVKDLAERVDVTSRLRSKRYVVGPIAQQVADAGQNMGLGSVRQSAGGNLFRGGVGQTNRNLGAENLDASLASGFVLDTENGAFTYFGTESQHERVDELVKSYREQTEANRKTIETYKLHHIPAEDMADLLNAILEDPAQRNQFGGSPFLPGSRQQAPATQPQQPTTEPIEGEVGEAAAGGDGEGFVTATADQVTITFDVSRNLIVVRATPRNQREIERIIERLDQRQPQVLIEAQIVSVTINEDFSFAADVDLSAGQFEFLSTFGVTSPGASLQDTVTFPGENVSTGINTGLFRSDFVPFAIQALETVGDAKLISNPRILVNDNAPANVVSNEVRPFSSTTQGTATTVTSQGGTADAGTQLQVTPRISAGGYLVLEYQIELSAFIGQGQGGLQPPQQTENYESEVTIPSDSTIIVGGFISTTDSQDESRVPLLGEIPLIGNLFKSVTTQKVKRLIFVFITPKILDDPNFKDLRLATEGPLKDVQLEGIVPDLLPAEIPITAALATINREIGSRVDRSDLLLGTDRPAMDDEAMYGPRRDRDEESPRE